MSDIEQRNTTGIQLFSHNPGLQSGTWEIAAQGEEYSVNALDSLFTGAYGMALTPPMSLAEFALSTLYPSDRKRFADFVKRTFKSREKSVELRLWNKNTHEWIWTEVTVVGTAQGGYARYQLVNIQHNLSPLALEKEKNDNKELDAIIGSSVPVACCIWDENLRCVGCNTEALRLVQVDDKKTFIKGFSHFSRPIQPGGKNSVNTLAEYTQKTLQEGNQRFEWLIGDTAGNQIPIEATLVRAAFKEVEVVVAYAKDLRELFSIKDKLLESQERMQLMLDSSPLACNFWDRDLNNIDCNAEAARLFDLSSKEEYLTRFFELSPPVQPDGRSTMEAAQEHINRAFAEGYDRFEWMHQKLNGEPMPSEITLVRLMHRNNPIVVGYTKDLREINSMKDSLNEAQERMQLMLDSTRLACNFWDHNLNNIDCNAEAARLFDLSSKEEYLARFFELSPPVQPDGRSTMDAAREHVTRAFVEGYDRFEWMHQKLNREPIPPEITLVRIMHRGNPVVIGYTKDLRELKAAQRVLNSERLLLKKVLDSSPVSFTILVDGKARFVTPITTKLLGLVEGGSLEESFIHAEDYKDFLSAVQKKDTLNWHPIPMRSAKGKNLHLLANAFQAEYFDKPCLMIWFMDVTEMLEQEKKLRKARDAAESSNRAKSVFLANMSHEIRTPMNAILGIARLILESELTERQRDFMLKAEKAAKDLLHILNDILDFSKIEAGKLDVEMVEFEPEKTIRSIVDIFSPLALNKGLVTLIDMDPETPEKIIGDPYRLKQVLSNLLSNAVKFTNVGEITIGSTVLDTTQTHVTMRFFVRDSGIGLTKKELGKLFKSFTQADASTTRRYGGTGLGLIISKRLTELMGGTISCESQKNVGTQFSVEMRFPLASKSFDPAGEFNPGNVLIVDNRFRRGLHMEELIGHMNGKTTLVQSIKEAIEHLGHQMLCEHYNFMLINNILPDGDPLELIENIKEICNGKNPVPVVCIPAEATDLEKTLKARNIPYAVKPLSFLQLKESLQTVVNRQANTHVQQSPLALLEKTIREKLHQARVLLVEDNDINQIIAEELLSRVDLRVDIAGNGKEALEKIAANDYDLVFMDIQMPEMDGLTATRHIRANTKHSHLPIVAMTAHAMVGDRELSLEAGMNDHITKPLQPEEVYGAVCRWIHQGDV